MVTHLGLTQGNNLYQEEPLLTRLGVTSPRRSAEMLDKFTVLP